MIGAGFIFFALIGLVLFLFIWPFSRDFMVRDACGWEYAQLMFDNALQHAHSLLFVFQVLLVAWGLGLTITIVLKMVLVKTCRKKFYAGFYRTNPNAANLAILALECWFIGMGGGGKILAVVHSVVICCFHFVFTLFLFSHIPPVLVGRFTQFILAACFYVGRIDVPFLSRGKYSTCIPFNTVIMYR